MRVASSCFDSLVRCSVLELCLFPLMDGAVRWMTSWLPMDEPWAVCRASSKTCFLDAPLRSGNRPTPQHCKSDESSEVEETSAEEDQDWNADSDADWTIDSEGRSSLSGGSVCALVASDGQTSLRRSISEINLLVSEEEVNQTFACWKEDLVQLWTTCFWPTCVTMVGIRNSISPRCWSQVSRSPSGRPAKRTGRCSLGHALHRLALHTVVSETCVLFAVNAFWATLSSRVTTVSTVFVSQRDSECRSCVVAPNAIDFAFTADEPVPCAQMMELCKALEEQHLELEDLHFEQYRARDELPLMQQWARGGADDRVTLSADLETMDLLTTATPPTTLSAAEPWRLRNDFEDFFGTRRPQLIRSAGIALASPHELGLASC